MASVIIQTGPLTGKEFAFEREIVLGRGQTADVSLDDGTISRRHAKIDFIGSTAYVSDLHSGNGTILNGRLIKDMTALKDGDEIQLGAVLLRFRTGDGEPETGPSSSVRLTDSSQSVLHAMAAESPIAAFEPGEGAEAMAQMSRRLQLVQEVGQAIAQTLQENELFSLILEKVFEVFPQAGRGIIMVYDAASEQLDTRAARTRSGEVAEIQVSQTLVWDVIRNRRGILSVDAMQDDRFAMAQTVHQLEIHSVVSVPMIAKGEILGVIHVDGDPGMPFRPEDMAVLLGIAGQAALSLANARLHERLLMQQLLEQDLAFAKKIQSRFLPKEPPKVRGYEFQDEYISALDVGGDYYDFMELPQGLVGIALGDVSGKGVSAALYMAKLSSEVRYRSAGRTAPGDILRRVNRSISRDLEEGMFVTLVFLVLNPQTHEISIASAGHMAPLLRRANGEILTLEVPRAVPLGIAEDSRFGEETYKLQPGDVVVAFTDGVSEAMNRSEEQFGEARLANAMRKCDGSSLGVLHSIIDAVRNFTEGQPQSDDITLVCVGREETGEGTDRIRHGETKKMEPLKAPARR